MAYTPINNTQVDPDSPVTADLMTSLRDNPIAIANGDAGAPRIQDAALGGTVTIAGRGWVGARVAALPAGEVGSYALLETTVGTGAAFGGTVAGSGLRPASAEQGVAGTISGTWRCMGNANAAASSAAGRVTLFLRIS